MEGFLSSSEAEMAVDQTSGAEQVNRMEESGDTDICSSRDYTVFRWMEFGIKIIPSLLFFILGTMRWLKIRDIGQGRVQYSLHFKSKLGISSVMGAAYLLYVIVCWAQPADAAHSSWINRCDDDYFVVFYAIQGLAWLFSCFLMVYEYRRRLSEEWYANQLFWCLNFIFEVVTFLVLVKQYAKDPTMMTLSIINMSGNLMLIILMVRTERRTMENRRPETSGNLDVLLMSNEQPRRRQNSSSIEGPFIRVKFYDKVIHGREGVNVFQFRVSTHGRDASEIKLAKKYSEFQLLQSLVNDQSLKQSDLFMDGSIMLDQEDANRSYKAPTIALQVPRLEEQASLTMSERLTTQPLTSGPAGQNPDQVVSFIKNLERFSNEVAENKLFWTPEVIAFFGITDVTLKREFEFAREETMRQLQTQREGSQARNRRQSYVNIERGILTNDHEITEEFASGDSGSTKNSKKVQPQLFDAAIAPRMNASNSAVHLGQEPAAVASQQQFTEDLQNSLYDELRVGQYPLSVKFLMWQDSNIGNYIEFKLQVTYHEGHENQGKRASLVSPHNSGDSSSSQMSNHWVIYKRYSNFIDFHEVLVPYFKAEGLQPPALPPKIANSATAHRNQALTQRKNQLQAYLRQVILMLSDRAPVPLLQFLGLHEQPHLGFFSLEPVARLSAVNLRQLRLFSIPQNKIMFVNNAPKVFYKVVLRYQPHSPLPGQQSQAPAEEEVITFKQFADFKQLDLIIRLTSFRLEESNHFMPLLPEKRNSVNGNKKSGEELQAELSAYMSDLLKIPKICRMLYFRMFLCLNNYPSITEESFNELQGEESQVTNFVHGQGDLSLTPRQTNNQTYATEHTSLLRESYDIGNLAVIARQNQHTEANVEEMGFDRSEATLQFVQPGNSQEVSAEEPSVNFTASHLEESDEDDPFKLT